MKEILIRNSENFFSVLIIIAAGIGLYQPWWFAWIKPYIPVLLGLVMMCIGLTINTIGLKAGFLKLRILTLLIMVKFIFLAGLGFYFGKIFNLSPEIIVGLVLVGTCPGGVSSSVMSYLAKSNVALTVALTIIATMICPLVMPTIIYFFLKKTIVVPFASIAIKLFWIVAFPLMDGLIIRRFFLNRVERITPILPLFSMLIIFLIIGCVAALNRQILLSAPWLVIALVLTMNLCGYLFGYCLGKFLKCDEKSAQAISFEYGMQDSSIGIMLATTFFSPISALPSALFSIIQNLTGPVLVRFFKKDRK